MAGKYDLTIEQGIKFTKTVTWKDESGSPVDMTGMTARMQIRSRDQVLIKEVPVAIDASLGQLTLTLSAEDTSKLHFGTAVYDLEVSVDGEPIVRLLKGVITLDKEVTEDPEADGE